MTRRRLTGRPGFPIAIAAAAALSVLACSATSSPSATATSTPVPAPTEPTELTIFAAASLRDLLDASKTAYEATNDGVTLLISTDSSAALETNRCQL